MPRHFGLPQQRRRGLDFGCGVGPADAGAGGARGRGARPRRRAVDDRARARLQPSWRSRALRRAGGAAARAVASRSIDVVVTGRVLQHIAPEFSRRYVSELARVLAPGGFLSFDVPSRPIEPALPAGAMPPRACRARPRGAPARDRRRAASRSTWSWPTPATSPGPMGHAAQPRDRIGSPPTARCWRSTARGPHCRCRSGLATRRWSSTSFQARARPARRVLELDRRARGRDVVRWTGSPTMRITLDGRSIPRPGGPRSPRRRWRLRAGHGDARRPACQEVEALLRDAGVRLLRVRPEAHCGPRWEAWRYDVTADAAG